MSLFVLADFALARVPFRSTHTAIRTGRSSNGTRLALHVVPLSAGSNSRRRIGRDVDADVVRHRLAGLRV